MKGENLGLMVFKIMIPVSGLFLQPVITENIIGTLVKCIHRSHHNLKT